MSQRPGAGAWLGVALAVFSSQVFAESTATEFAPPPFTEVRTFGLGGGRFEVVSEPGEEGARLARLAEMAWEAWQDPFSLPGRLPTGITVRLVPSAERRASDPAWRVSVEIGGNVSVWISAEQTAGIEQERIWLAGLADGALRRLAVLRGIAPERVAAPPWLLLAAAEAVLVRQNPALLDAWQQQARRGAPLPSLRETLLDATPPGRGVDERRRVAAFGVWQWLQAEAKRSSAWTDLVAELIAGGSPGAVLVRAYPAQFGGAEAREIELAWQVAAAGISQTRTLPLWDADESRVRLEQAARLVVAPRGGGEDDALWIGEIWLARRDAFVASQRDARLAWLTANYPRFHPFYRNAANSLGRLLTALSDSDPAGWSEALRDWREDIALARELEAASTRLLDEAR